jgi:LPXTG-site transpeptidase (sortase) family protein
MTIFRARTRSRHQRSLELFFLFAGILALGVWSWSQLHEALYQDWSNWAFDRGLAGEKISVTDYLKERWAGHTRTTEPAPAGQTTGSTPGPYPKSNIVGRIEIPRLHLQAMVREGTRDATLDVALGHIAGTALPGQNGNVAVAGHRDRLFRGLKDISPGDQIVFETPSAKFAYQVESTQIVKPADVGVLKAGLYPELTLVTCYPFTYVGSAPDRFIVKARQVEQVAVSKPLSAPQPLAVSKPAPPPPPPEPARSVTPPEPPQERNTNRVAFEVTSHHSRQLTTGISVGLTSTDSTDKSADGWMWVLPDRRTIWLRSLHVREPLIFYGDSDGRRRELVLTAISDSTIRGYLVTDNSPALSASSAIR